MIIGEKCLSYLSLWRVAAIFFFIAFIGEFILIGVLKTKNQEIQHQLNEMKIKQFRIIDDN